jgi:hypothetical protein
LVIPVDGALGIHLKTALALALRATIRPELSFLVLNKRPERRTALQAIKPCDFELGKHATATSNDTTDVDEMVQVLIANIAYLS